MWDQLWCVHRNRDGDIIFLKEMHFLCLNPLQQPLGLRINTTSYVAWTTVTVDYIH